MEQSHLEETFANLTSQIAAVKDDVGLEVMHEYLRNHPNFFSERTLSKVTNLRRLVYELSKKQIISSDSVSALADIVCGLNNGCIASLYEEHIRSIHEYSQSPAPAEIVAVRPTEHAHNLRAASNLLPPKVKQIIGSRIGRKWTEFARQLNVPDAEIDEIEQRYREIQPRVNDVLRWYEQEKNNLSQTDKMLEISRCLQKSRRSDIAEDLKGLCS